MSFSSKNYMTVYSHGFPITQTVDSMIATAVQNVPALCLPGDSYILTLVATNDTVALSVVAGVEVLSVASGQTS